MKNIWIIPTDKPSRLTLLNNEKLLFSKEDCEISKTKRCINQNIYITSDEKIKKGDGKYPVLGCKGTVYKDCPETWKESGDWKKIILTTDQDLIKNGVQPIDDEFLEWFIKNPSCEEINILKKYQYHSSKKFYIDADYINCSEEQYELIKEEIPACPLRILYKIIIPKQEPKQFVECKCTNSLQAENCIRNCGHGEEPEQETLEEAAERITMIKDWDFESSEANGYYDYVEGFKEGAKWQQERMHSNEEVLQILFRFTNKFDLRKNIDISFQEQLKWFEEFKK